jgi:hypothetical protein
MGALDGLENTRFRADYWDDGLVGIALYLLHLTATEGVGGPSK